MEGKLKWGWVKAIPEVSLSNVPTALSGWVSGLVWKGALNIKTTFSNAKPTTLIIHRKHKRKSKESKETTE